MNENSARTALDPDLETVAQVLTPVEDRESRLARRSQKRYRISELSLIVGAVVAVTLGAVAAASGADPQTAGSGSVWITLETALTFFLGSLAFVESQIGWHTDWLRHRSRAEALTSERFLFLGRAGPYAETDDSIRLLKLRVIAIEGLGS